MHVSLHYLVFLGNDPQCLGKAWLHRSRLSTVLTPVQRESFDVIGKVGFGRDFQASKDIDNPVNTFQQLTDDLEESVHRLIHPWRKYSLSKVPRLSHPHQSHSCACIIADECCSMEVIAVCRLTRRQSLKQHTCSASEWMLRVSWLMGLFLVKF